MKILRKLQAIFALLLLGQIGFLAVVHFFIQPAAPLGQEDDILLYILPIIMVFALTTGGLLSKQRFIESRKLTTLDEKLRVYQSTSLIQMALLEGANLTAIVFYLTGGNQAIALMAIIGLSAFVSLLPTTSRMQRELALQEEELS